MAVLQAHTIEKKPQSEDVESFLHTEPLTGLPRSLKVDGVSREFGPYMVARRAAVEYCLTVGISPRSLPRTYAKLDKARATQIAQLYDELESTPDDHDTKVSYAAFISETLAQWQVIKATGLQVEYNRNHEGEPEPYANPRRLILDIIQNNHLFVNPTHGAYGDVAYTPDPSNPLLAEVPSERIDGKVPLANDILRVVHDYFGHTREGLGFRAEGEYNAWRGHLAMYSPLARRAMTTEMWAQTCWINYGPMGAQNRRASMGGTSYAAQKMALLPEWVSEDPDEDAAVGVRLERV